MLRTVPVVADFFSLSPPPPIFLFQLNNTSDYQAKRKALLFSLPFDLVTFAILFLICVRPQFISAAHSPSDHRDDVRDDLNTQTQLTYAKDDASPSQPSFRRTCVRLLLFLPIRSSTSKGIIFAHVNLPRLESECVLLCVCRLFE